MKRRTFLLTFILLPPLVCAPDTLRAQEKPDLFSRIERAFREREPAWKVEQSRRGAASDPLWLSITFRSGKAQASIAVAVWRRGQDARESFAGESLATDNIHGKRAFKGTVPNLGDENHIWLMRGAAAWPMLFFRKGNVTARVFAPSAAVAERFARLVLEQIDAAER